jgi:hypothetical protein
MILNPLLMVSPRENFDLLCCRRNGRDFALKPGVRDQLDGEVEHQTIWVVLSQTVDERSPRRVLDQFSKPSNERNVNETFDNNKIIIN